MNVLVYGASGSQMGQVPHELARLGHRVVTFTRHTDKVAVTNGSSIVPVAGDLGDRASVRSATEGVDAVALHIPFLGDPSQLLRYFQHAVDAAKASRVKMLVWNTSGTIPPAPTGNVAIDYRIDALDYLRSSGVDFLVLAPTAYAENLLSPWSTAHLRSQHRISYPTPSDYGVGWLPTIDLARMIAHAVSRPELNGQILNVAGLQSYDGPELARVFSEALGKAISYYAMPPEEFGGILDRVLGEPGAGRAVASFYQAMWDNPSFRPPMHFDQTDVHRVIPTQRTSLLEWVRSNRGYFEP